MKPTTVAAILLAVATCLAPCSESQNQPAEVHTQPQGTATNSEGNKNKSHSYLDLLSPENLSTTILAVVGVVGVIVAICTLRKIAKQTDATKIAARAALLNAQAVINSERPWVVVTAEVNEHETIIVSGHIEGRTPAIILRGWGERPSHSQVKTACPTNRFIQTPRISRFCRK